MKKWTHQGKILPFEPGTAFQTYRIQSVRTIADRFFYLAESSHGPVVLAESLAFFQLDVLTQIHQMIQPQLAQLGMDCLDFFQYDWQGLMLNYIVYPAWLWQALDCPLKDSLWQDGLPEEQTVRVFYDWLQSQQQELMTQGWCNPSVALPMIYVAPDGNWLPLEWEYCVPIAHSDTNPSDSPAVLKYPRFFVGYHERAYQQPLELVKTAAYASLIAVLQGKSPKLWQLERVSWQSIRPLLASPMRQFLASYLESDSLWPVIPAKIYSEQAPSNDYVWAHQSFEKALLAYEQKQYANALLHCQTAAQTWLNDPWPHYLKAKIFESQGHKQLAIDALSQAWKYEKLAVFGRELAELLIDQGDANLAENYLKQVLLQTPFDDRAWYLLGCLAQQTEHLQQAQQYFAQACRLRPLQAEYRQKWEQLANALGTKAEISSRYPIGQKAHLLLDLAAPSSNPEFTGPWHREQRLSPEREHPSELWYATQARKDALLKLFISPQDCQAEAHFAAQLKHPAFLQIIDSAQNYIAYEYLKQGTDVQALIRQGGCQPEQLKSMASQLSAALSFLKQKSLTHGDLSPANLWWNAESASLKIIDYDNLRMTQSRVKTSVFTQTAYAPTEFLLAHQVDSSTDSYSASLSLLHLASGIFPDLCRDWHRRDFYRYRRYLTHLQDDWVECLLSNTRWDSAARTQIVWPELVLSRPMPGHLSELNQALLQLSECQDAMQAPGLIRDLMQIEKSLLTMYHAAYHAYRLHLHALSTQYAKACLSIDFRHVGALWILAETHLQHQKPDEALKLLLLAMQIDSQSPQTLQMLINAYRQSGRVNLAFAACQQLSRLMPDHLDVKLQEIALLSDFHFDTQALQAIHHLLTQTIPNTVRMRLTGLQRDLRIRQNQKNQPEIA